MIKGFVKRAARSVGVEVSRYDPQHSEAARLIATLRHLDVGLVLDVGANKGQYASSLRLAGYPGRIVSFEPLLEAHRELVLRAAGDPFWHVHPRCAIGSADSEIEINVSQNSVSSSVLPMLPAHENAAPDSRFYRKETTPLVRLDSVVTPLVKEGEQIFLKIDTQGYEAQVLDGASEWLPKIAGIQIELSLVPLYEGQTLWDGLVARLRSEGLVPWLLVPGFVDPASGRMLQMDGVFAREP